MRASADASTIAAAFVRLLKCRTCLTTIPVASIFGGSNALNVFEI